LLRPQHASALQDAALSRLKAMGAPKVAESLLAQWRSFSPGQRTEVLNALLNRPSWTEAMLSAVEQGKLSPAQISPAHQQRVLTHSQSAIRERAAKIFSTSADRKKVIKQYENVSDLKGNSIKGGALFRQHCAVCHRFQGEGTNIGPDLGTLANKSQEMFLVAIMDPNQAVESSYVSYTAIAKADREVTGIIVSETPTALTLRTAGGTEEIVMRNDLKELTSSGLSLMPEGFEKVMAPQDIADLIQYLASAGATQ
jgi:putative heme-binding domain-containing protein